MKRYDVCGIGNGLVDILVQVDEQTFARLGFEKGSNQISDEKEQKRILEILGASRAVMASGGSVANSIVAISQLQGRAAYISSLGDDRYGLHFENEFRQFGIELANHLSLGQMTGTVAVAITPDGERTMRFFLGAAACLGPQHVNEEVIAQSKYLFVEGYLFANPASSQEAVRMATKVARSSDCRVALTLSEPWVIQNFGTAIRELLPAVDLLFANEVEACTVTGATNVETAFEKLRTLVPDAVVTAGPRGAFVRFDGQEALVPAFPCRPVDLTGAGDMLAGAFLYGITHGYSAQESARAACYLAREVITRVGPRLSSGAAEYWKEGLAQSAPGR
ncbi:MAG: adenosine kinase [Oligoflexia bacterium]|nr:adenosine kinase [Oligoflexia bacterium]